MRFRAAQACLRPHAALAPSVLGMPRWHPVPGAGGGGAGGIRRFTGSGEGVSGFGKTEAGKSNVKSGTAVGKFVLTLVSARDHRVGCFFSNAGATQEIKSTKPVLVSLLFSSLTDS